MTNKIQISVKIMDIGIKADYLIPETMEIKDVIQLILQISCSASHPIYKRINQLVLYDADRNVRCYPNQTVADCGLLQGSSVLLL